MHKLLSVTAKRYSVNRQVNSSEKLSDPVRSPVCGRARTHTHMVSVSVHKGCLLEGAMANQVSPGAATDWPSGPLGRLIETDRPRTGLGSDLPLTGHPSSPTTAILQRDNKAFVCTAHRITSQKQQDQSHWADEGNLGALILGVYGLLMHYMPATNTTKTAWITIAVHSMAKNLKILPTQYN